MIESKHSFTPGPWELRYTDSYEYKVYAGSIVSDDFARIATASDLFDDNGEANARLIAAAPDLLYVAELVVSWLDEEEGAHALCDKARAAIAKATLSPPTREEGVRGND